MREMGEGAAMAADNDGTLRLNSSLSARRLGSIAIIVLAQFCPEREGVLVFVAFFRTTLRRITRRLVFVAVFRTTLQRP